VGGLNGTHCIILPVVPYGCETWSLTLREEHGLKMFENKVQRGIFGPKRHKVRERWRKLLVKFLKCIWSIFEHTIQEIPSFLLYASLCFRFQATKIDTLQRKPRFIPAVSLLDNLIMHQAITVRFHKATLIFPTKQRASYLV
jgi:hypothetical protein